MRMEMMPQERFEANETVEGVRLSCAWNEELGGYALSLPETEGGSEALFISTEEAIAARVFEFAKELALGGNDSREIYMKSEALAKEIGSAN